MDGDANVDDFVNTNVSAYTHCYKLRINEFKLNEITYSYV